MDTMVKLWVDCIFAGKKTFYEVPENLKEAVREHFSTVDRLDLIEEI